MCSSNTRATVLYRFVRNGKFAQIMTNHIRLTQSAKPTKQRCHKDVSYENKHSHWYIYTAHYLGVLSEVESTPLCGGRLPQVHNFEIAMLGYLNFNSVEFLAVVHTNNASNHFGCDNHVA